LCENVAEKRLAGSDVLPTSCLQLLSFSRIINKHTDESLGDCSFLNTCFHMDTCKYVHYEIDSPPEAESSLMGPLAGTPEIGLHAEDADSNEGKLFPSQWICCDIRFLDMSILGKFSVVMADPPWDIHMELPYGTLTDDEMRKLSIPALQDDGFLFLWVTGRNTGCMYAALSDAAVIYSKLLIFVGVKGSTQGFNRGLDCDVIVAEVRSTSHKPDEIYGMIERLSPGTRKIELFGRPHNVQPNW
ncbi:N6-adenosine-methyltransferase subunit mettl3, partial [Xenoophorus captivus]